MSENLVEQLRMPGSGALWGPPITEEAADFIESQAATITALQAENERLEAGVRKFLEMLEHGYAPNIEGALAEAMCCSGQMCGCRGASVGEYLAHLLRSDVGINRVNSAALSDLIADTAGYPEPNITLTGGDHG